MIPDVELYKTWQGWGNKIKGLLQKADDYLNLKRIYNPTVSFTGATVTASSVEYDPQTGRLAGDITFTDPGATVVIQMAGLDLTARTQMAIIAGIGFSGVNARYVRYTASSKTVSITAVSGDVRIIFSVVV